MNKIIILLFACINFSCTGSSILLAQNIVKDIDIVVGETSVEITFDVCSGNENNVTAANQSSIEFLAHCVF